MSIYSRIFVFVIFAILAMSFWATVGLLYWEFADDWRRPEFEGALWFDLMTHHSHMFLFFPLFGTLALVAFFLPAVVFVDMYWRQAVRKENEIPYSKLRFSVGFLIAILVSAGASHALNLGDESALWQLKPDKVRERATFGEVCAEPGLVQEGNATCRRVTFPAALENVRRVSQDRERITDLKRQCAPDPLIERIEGPLPRRYCFVTAAYSRDAAALAPKLLDDPQCCLALQRFEAAVNKVYDVGPANRSWLDRVQVITLAMKIFFLLVVLIISILLAFRRKRILSQFGHLSHRIDRGVLIGTVAMLFLPLMNHAFLLSTELMYGPNQPLVDASGVSFYRVPYALSIAFGIWGFFIMLFFIRREDKEAERMSKIIGTIASGVFVLKYDAIVDYAVRFAGPGAGNQSVMGLALVAIVMWVVLVGLWAKEGGSRGR